MMRKLNHPFHSQHRCDSVLYGRCSPIYLSPPPFFLRPFQQHIGLIRSFWHNHCVCQTYRAQIMKHWGLNHRLRFGFSHLIPINFTGPLSLMDAHWWLYSQVTKIHLILIFKSRQICHKSPPQKRNRVLGKVNGVSLKAETKLTSSMNQRDGAACMWLQRRNPGQIKFNRSSTLLAKHMHMVMIEEFIGNVIKSGLPSPEWSEQHSKWTI